jgi:hypothetical protein
MVASSMVPMSVGPTLAAIAVQGAEHHGIAERLERIMQAEARVASG